MIKALKAEFNKAADPLKAQGLARFFKTGKGQYAEGDRFLGLSVPLTRRLACRFQALPHGETLNLLRSGRHEERLCALMIMIERFRRGNRREQERIYRAYLANTRFINNWDLVDLSAEHIVGAWLAGKSKKQLFKLAGSQCLWEKRIAMVACLHYIRRSHCSVALKVARRLLPARHDLLHKATGWMLREVGKRCSEEILLNFLKTNYARLPRTTLRYAIERFPHKKRKQLLAGRF